MVFLLFYLDSILGACIIGCLPAVEVSSLALFAFNLKYSSTACFTISFCAYVIDTLDL